MVYVLTDPQFWESVRLGCIYALRLDRAADWSRRRRRAGRQRSVSGPQHRPINPDLPYVIPTVVAVILWKWLLNSQFGLITIS
jgi:multiple sugar transport system permease protein